MNSEPTQERSIIRFVAKAVLLDIEGTTSSIRFVYDEMFPFVRRELDRFLNDHWADQDVQNAANQIAIDAGAESFQAFCKQNGGDPDGLSEQTSRDALTAEVIRQMDNDLKATGLKQLQGLIWKSGFESGELKAHLYPDVAGQLREWRARQIDLRIYSSGSVKAQHLFFGHTIEGDLLDLFSGHDDTTTGSKKESESYSIIAQKFGLPAGEILFVSDSLDELDAAAESGMQTVWSCRPQNPAPDRPSHHPAIESFEQIDLTSE